MTKKIPISFNEKDLRQVNEIINLMANSKCYGAFPKAVKFGISLALSTLKNPEKVYSSLDDDELAVYFSSIKRYELLCRILKKAESIKETAKKV